MVIALNGPTPLDSRLPIYPRQPETDRWSINLPTLVLPSTTKWARAMYPPSAESSEGPNSIDLLIRGITTILWLLWPKVKDGRPHSKHRLQRLSRLSLLFVPAVDASNTAALTVAVDRDVVYVEAVQGSQQPLEGGLELVKDHAERYVHCCIEAVPNSELVLAIPRIQ